MKLIGYTRVSTEQQGMSGLGKEAQTEAINRYVHAHGHEVVYWANDIISSRKESRPGWELVQANLTAAHGEGVIVAKLDRISRSVRESADIFERFKKYGWNIIALDLGVDTSTPAGKMVAGIMAVVSEWERDVISQRTTDALAVKKANGDKLGRPYPTLPREVESLITEWYALEMNVTDITTCLNNSAYKSRGTGKWYPSTVKRHMQKLGLIT